MFKTLLSIILSFGVGVSVGAMLEERKIPECPNNARSSMWDSEKQSLTCYYTDKPKGMHSFSKSEM